MLTCTFSLLSLRFSRIFALFFLTFSFSFLHMQVEPYDYFLCCKEIVCVELNCLAYVGILFK